MLRKAIHVFNKGLGDAQPGEIVFVLVIGNLRRRRQKHEFKRN
jgi:hypothetical protein